MLQYIYEPSACDLKEWPSGTLRLESIPVTDNPRDADVFVCPGSLALFREPRSLYRLPLFKGRESRHVFFDVSDHETIYNQPSIFIRCNLRPFNLKGDPNSIAFAWPVEDYADCIELPGGGFKYDVSFQGWTTSHESRKLSTDSCLAKTDLKCDIACYTDFTGYIFYEPEGIRRRAAFRRSMKESRVALCPESINGVFPYRFFEAMSAGRVPVLVGSDFVFPSEDQIPYKEFCLIIGRNDAHCSGDLIRTWLSGRSDSEIISMGLEARHYWAKYLDSRYWPKLMADAVEKKLQCTTAV